LLFRFLMNPKSKVILEVSQKMRWILKSPFD